jgi:hypothetical protein
MAKTLDFNKLSRPILPMVMCDETKTIIKVTTPREVLVEELQATLPELQHVMDGKDQEAVDLCYDLAARLISCNIADLEVTVEDLRTKYWPRDRIINQLYLVEFYSAYVDFIREINNAKN